MKRRKKETDTGRVDLIQTILDSAEPHRHDDRPGTYKQICFRVEEGRSIREELDRQIARLNV